MNNVKHRVSLGDMQGYSIDSELAGSYGKGSCKSLIGRTCFITRDVQFIVKEDRNIVLHTNCLAMAVEKYNELA